MLRKMTGVALMMCLGLGAAMAEELRGVISQIDKEKVTFKEGKKDAEVKTYELSKEIKVYRFVKKDQKELDPDGLSAEPLPKLPKGGVLAVITVVEGKVTEISLPSKKKN